MNKAQKQNYYISVAGVMGSGKTTASQLLADELGFPLFAEPADENVFLPLFYKEPKRWAFHVQLNYLRDRAHHLMKIKDLLQETSVVQDGPIYQDYFTYGKAQQILGYMSPEEFALYEKYFNEFSRDLPVPHIIVQLDASLATLAERIQKRARDYEAGIDMRYVELLSELQQDWIRNHPHLRVVRVNTDHLDLTENQNHRQEFVHMIKKLLYNK